MTDTRSKTIGRLAKKIIALDSSRPIRVAIDGRTASGKTTLADELSKAIEQAKRPVIRTSIDGFHRPKIERYARGRYSAEGYYHDARDLNSIVRLLLKPLGEGGDRHYCTASFDLAHDVPLPLAFNIAESHAVLVLLCHKYAWRTQQYGHLCNRLEMWAAIRQRSVAIESDTCRCMR